MGNAGQLLVVMAENKQAFYMGKLLSNWSRDVIVFTNGYRVPVEKKAIMARQHVAIVEETIEGLKSKDRQLISIRPKNG